MRARKYGGRENQVTERQSSLIYTAVLEEEGRKKGRRRGRNVVRINE